MRHIQGILIGTGLLAAGGWLMIRLLFMSMTGSFFPVRIEEKLSNPVSAPTWVPDGILIRGGSKVLPLGMTRLPERSNAIQSILRHGVELHPDGRVFGLVEAHPSCGNDPVVSRLVRVDIGSFLHYIGQGESSLKQAYEGERTVSVEYDFESSSTSSRLLVGYKRWLNRRQSALIADQALSSADFRL